MRIDQATIREILSKTDIGAFIGSYVPLNKRGNDLVGLCPFHNEKTPSFHVHPDRGFFKCFGCGQSGDAIKFMQLRDNLPFPEALRELARRAGVALEEEDPAAARIRGEKERIFGANEIAVAYFHRMLVASPEGQAARAYVESRGLDSATIETFKLGYAPDAWDGLLRELDRNDVARETAVAAGLVRPGQNGYYDFYRNRLMIPTYASTGEAVAFGGRSLDGREPKYLNTSTTPVYVKGRGLYALSVARRSAATKRFGLIVVEGYLDCIALHQAGFGNAVAALGTAFTPAQAAELRKYAERVFLCFDADTAGSNATAKSIDVLIEAGCAPYIVQLPPGEDPDTSIRTHGAAAFTEKLQAAFPWIQFKLDRDIGEIREKGLSRAQAASHAESLVRALPREEWDRWRVYAAQRLGLAADDLRVSRFAADRANFAPRASGGSRHVAATAEPPSIEREVISIFVEDPALLAEYEPDFPPEFFRDARYARVYAALRVAQPRPATGADVGTAVAGDAQAMETVVALLKPDRSSTRHFQDSAARRAHLDRAREGLVEGRYERRLRDLDAKIDSDFEAGRQIAEADRAEADGLRRTLEQIRRKRLGAH